MAITWSEILWRTAPSVCVIRSDLGFRTFSDFMKSSRELVLGASGKG